MNAAKTRILLTVAVVLATFGANRAMAGFVRPKAALAAPGEQAVLLWDAEFSGQETSPGGAGPAAAAPGGPDRDEGGDRPTIQHFYAAPGGGTGACETPSTGQSGGSGSTSAAAPGASSVVPEPVATSWLPDEMGPAFCNPPPWVPLRPPRV